MVNFPNVARSQGVAQSYRKVHWNEKQGATDFEPYLWDVCHHHAQLFEDLQEEWKQYILH